MIRRNYAAVAFTTFALGLCVQLNAANVATGGGGGGAAAGGGGHTSGGGAVAAPSGGGVSSGGAKGSGGAGGDRTGEPTAPSGGTQTPGNATPSKAGHGDGHDHAGYPNGVAYPYSPFAYGYGGDSGYGNGYGNNGVANTNNSQATLDNSNQGGNVSTNSGVVSPPQVTSTGSDVNAAAARLQNAADHSPQLLALQAAVQKDQQDYDGARNRVLAQLHAEPDFKKALADRGNAGAEVRTAKTVDPSNTNAVMTAAEAKLNAGDTVTKMEQSAIDQDQPAAAAKAKLASDMTKLAAMRDSAGVK